MTPQDFVWSQVEPVLFCTREQFFERLAGWNFIPEIHGGRTVGVLMEKDGEIHLAAEPGVIRRRHIHALLSPLLEKHGRLTTKVSTLHDDGFVQRLGFVFSHADAWDNHYTLTELRHA